MATTSSTSWQYRAKAHTRHHLRLTTVRQAGREARSRHVIAAEGLATVGRTIAAYRRSDGAATDYELAWVTVTLQDGS
jgi:hypothetical protein